jgi:hypothetical protein
MSTINLPSVTKTDSAASTKLFFDTYGQRPLEFGANEVAASIGFFTSKGFEEEAALTTAMTILRQARVDGVQVFEILDMYFQANISPQPARDVILSHKVRELFELCRDIPNQAYLLGGGNLYTWETPQELEMHTSIGSWTDWMKCYGNKEMASEVDAIGRRFGYDPKWKK